MARGVDATHKPYTIDADWKLPAEERTVFWLRLKNNDMGNETQDRYLKARVLNDGGIEGYDKTLVGKADEEEFLMICNKVENWAWSSQYLAAHPQVKAKTNDQGFYTEPITDPDMLRDMVHEFPNGLLNELIAVTNDQVRLDAAAKKNSSG